LPAHPLTLLFLPEQARKGSPGQVPGFLLCAIPFAEALPRKAADGGFAPQNLTKPNIDTCLIAQKMVKVDNQARPLQGRHENV